MSLEHRLSALLQLHLHSRLNTWLHWIGQRQLQDEARNIPVCWFGESYIRYFTVRSWLYLCSTSAWHVMPVILYKQTLCLLSQRHEYSKRWCVSPVCIRNPRWSPHSLQMPWYDARSSVGIYLSDKLAIYISKFSSYQLFCVIFVDQMTSFEMADDISRNPATLRVSSLPCLYT